MIKSFMLIYFSAIVILSICLVFIVRNKDTLLNFNFIQDFQDDGVESTRKAEQTQSETKSSCKFGFGFLQKLEKNLKQNQGNSLSHVLLQRPISGAIRQQKMCTDSMDGSAGDPVSVDACHGQGRNQEWTLTKSKQIRSEGRGTLCLSWNEKKGINVFLQHCNDASSRQKWLLDSINGIFKPASNPEICLDHFNNKLSVRKCSHNAASQHWSFIMTEVLNIELQAKHDI